MYEEILIQRRVRGPSRDLCGDDRSFSGRRVKVLSLSRNKIPIKDWELHLVLNGLALELARKWDENRHSMRFSTREH
jgi:hypothetical protein